MHVFVDTAAWIALLNSDDALLKRDAPGDDQAAPGKARLVTTAWVLLELANALSAPKSRIWTLDKGYTAQGSLSSWDKV